MVATRIELMEVELQATKDALAEKKTAHAATKVELVRLTRQVAGLERQQQRSNKETQLIALKWKLQKTDAKNDGEDTEVFTNEEVLQDMLPVVPVHTSDKYDASALPLCLQHRAAKRGFDEMDGEEPSDNNPTPSKFSKGQRAIVCIRCYEWNLRCDPGEPCENCRATSRKCKRSKCKNYETGTCKLAHCLRVHREDEESYENIVHAGHVAKMDPSKLVLPTLKKLERDDGDGKKGGSGRPKGGGTGLALLA